MLVRFWRIIRTAHTGAEGQRVPVGQGIRYWLVGGTAGRDMFLFGPGEVQMVVHA